MDDWIDADGNDLDLMQEGFIVKDFDDDELDEEQIMKKQRMQQLE